MLLTFIAVFSRAIIHLVEERGSIVTLVKKGFTIPYLRRVKKHIHLPRYAYLKDMSWRDIPMKLFCINPFNTNAIKGIMVRNAEITNSLLILFKLALTILNNEVKIKLNTVIVLINKMLRFNSPVTFAISSMKNATISPTIPNINEAINHFVNLSILSTTYLCKSFLSNLLRSFKCKPFTNKGPLPVKGPYAKREI